MKLKSLLVLLLAGIWGVGSWWWYTCKIKDFCGSDTTAAQVATGAAVTGAAALSDYGSNGGSDQQTSAGQADADKTKASEATGTAAMSDSGQQTSSNQTEADQAAADKAKAEADQAAADKAKAEADQAAADKTKAEADQATADKAKADADQATADKAKADADQAKTGDQVTMETSGNEQGTDIGPATLHFPTGSANPQLADTTKSYFAKVAQFLKDNSGAKVTIVGHTDNKGDPAKNKALGLKRAQMLQKVLIDLGAPKDRVSASSEGADKPIADNSTEQGREKNRRVEITPEK
jgi:outer membrane protein OmpA-like peptidoglycan-associated protein